MMANNVSQSFLASYKQKAETANEVCFRVGVVAGHNESCVVSVQPENKKEVKIEPEHLRAEMKQGAGPKASLLFLWLWL